MEHVLINQLIRLLCKAGGETFVGNFQKDLCNDTAKEEQWKPQEIEDAVAYVNYINEYFGREEAKSIVIALMANYNISISELTDKVSLNAKS